MENRKIIYYEQLDSTNAKVKELAIEGAEHGTVVVADVQTAGKGRRGRRWESPAGTNIYMSMLLRPKMEPSKAPMLTLVMAHSISKVLQVQGYSDVRIKWPNDLVLSSKKVCGILTEMNLKGQEIDYVVVGVGINVNTTSFPEELTDKATSLYLETGKEVERGQLVREIVKIFEKEYERFVEIEDLSFLQEAYNNILINRNKEVRVLEPGKEYTAHALGINKTGELLVKKADGSQEAVFAGEVSVRGLYGYV